MHISYPPELPITARRDDLADAISNNQVVIVAGETGSGKTTQLPKICLELGRGVTGKIGHTQPRRLAARTIATRIAEELDTPLGEVVGWKVRFTDQVSARTQVKLMTDGILLAELGQDRMLNQYDTLIIDEAHERSLNIDFILGYLKRLLPRRPDLKLIITSATIDPERFAEHFGEPGRPAPIIEVSGRTYPVEVRYRPLTDPDRPDDDERDQPEAIVAACRELAAEGPGDILVFLPGERDIRDATETLAGAITADGTRGLLRDTELLPLYARLSSAEQQRVWGRPSQGVSRRIVLATNVAETSLTVPGIKYVVDTGTARISRYSHRTKVQRLPIEKVSQASANQRAGRCGRTSDGICIRLYAEDDYDARDQFTDPEILRTNLASVMLRMISLGLGEVADFPFVDPPDKRAVTDGVNLLHELGAVTGTDAGPQRKITEIGRSLDRLPIDPRFARMLLEAGRNGCAADVLVIVAALSIQDPRERPADNQQAADASHARFADPRSDFMGYLNLWRYLKQRRAELSSNQFRRMCRQEYLHYLRIREWQDLHGQLRRVLRELDISTTESDDETTDPKAMHQSLLAGLLSHIGLQTEPPTSTNNQQQNRNRQRAQQRQRNTYLGARSASFAIFPGSALFRRPPRWVMAAELVETSRLWGRTVARIEPEWIEPLATHLVRSTFSEPAWSAKRGAVMAHERVTLYGVPIVVDRLTTYTSVDPELCRELFIRHALVAGEWRTHHPFFHRNRELLDEVGEWEQRARRRDIGIDEQTLFEFYDKRIPERVASTRHFDRWWKTASRDNPDLLTMTLEEITHHDGVSENDYPSFWSTSTPGAEQPARLALNYEFEPGTPDDGVSVDIPLALLHRVDEAAFSWQVPGHREELVTALIRSLRKDLRRNFVPVPDTVRAALTMIDPARGSLLSELSRVLRQLAGVTVPPDAWRWDHVPDHLRITFRVIGEDGAVVGTGKDLAQLRDRLARRTRAALSEAAGAEVERTGVRAWSDLGAELPRTVRRERDGYQLVGYPALVDAGESVSVRVMASEVEQQTAMSRGTRRLLLLNSQSPVRQVRRRLSNTDSLALSRGPHGSLDALLADCLDAATDAVLARAGGPSWTSSGFERLLTAMRTGLTGALVDVVAGVVSVLAAHTEAEARLADVRSPGVESSLADVRAQLSALVYPGFVAATGADRLADVARYLRATSRRLETLPREPTRDRDWMARVQEVQVAYQELLDAQPAGTPPPPSVTEIRWMIEELRVSFFAQTLGTRYPVSEKRIYKALDDQLP
ncbi:ATP-dependent RNA helicase HrpA [Pseudonocardia spinosispora]|uniref:ATP-dependent RNA helicase HrpA n=1 Tax=Pseudonocardia spinosispora TaxID=103441 RepID=UPI00041669DC|nr:ATP-dependent RNA helicase HrpA [Pseudonocardia spinosispora]